MPAPNPDVRLLQKQLLREISTRMPQYGFSSRPVGQSFRRNESFGMSSFHIGFISHSSEFDITADVALRIDAVEEVLNSGHPLLTQKEKSQTFTVGAELGNIAEGRQRRWTMSNNHHVPLVASGMLEMFERIGLPYLKRLSDFEYLLYMLSNHDKEARLASPIHEHRCKTIAVLGQELGKPESFLRTLSAQCDEYLAQRNDPGLDSFRSFVRRLRSSGE